MAGRPSDAVSMKLWPRGLRRIPHNSEQARSLSGDLTVNRNPAFTELLWNKVFPFPLGSSRIEWGSKGPAGILCTWNVLGAWRRDPNWIQTDANKRRVVDKWWPVPQENVGIELLVSQSGVRRANYERKTVITTLSSVDRMALVTTLPKAGNSLPSPSSSILFVNSQSNMSQRKGSEQTILCALFQ
jgi:hypothetical protein